MMRGPRPPFAADDRAQAVVMVAITMMTMLFAIGLAIDSGQLFVARRTAQEAADSAAYAGAVVLYQQSTQSLPLDEVAARNAAITDATLNGFTDGANGGRDSVTVSLPPTSGPNAGNHRYIEVVITTQVRTTLVPKESGLTMVGVRGVAGSEPLNNLYAIMALDRGNTPDAFRVGSNGDVHLTGGGILVNSTCTMSCSPDPAGSSDQNTHSRFTIADPYGVDVAGLAGSPTSWNPAMWPLDAFGTTKVQTGQAQQPDPFASWRPAPSTSGMTTYSSVGAVSYSGVYTARLSGTKVCHGIYILKAGMGGDISRDTTDIDPSTGQLCDGKVMIYNTLSNYPNPGGTCAAIDPGGNHDIDLAALTTGTYANMVIWQDRACTLSINLNGSSLSVTLTGTIYAPTAALVLDGNNMTITGGQIVTKTFDVQDANVTINFSATNSAQPILPRLSE